MRVAQGKTSSMGLAGALRAQSYLVTSLRRGCAFFAVG
jgi:hypothetical protein